MPDHSAEIVAFPAAARLADVREAAQTIKNLHGPEAETWWKRRARALADSLLASHVPESQVGTEVAAFQKAVFFELTRLYEESA